MSKVSESTKYEAEILQSAGLLYEDILNLIVQRIDATKQHVKALFEDAGVQTVMISNQVHTEAGAVPIAIRQDLGMKQIITKYENDILDFMERINYNRFTVGDNGTYQEHLKATIIHEYGHILADQRIGQINGIYPTLDCTYPRAKELRKNIQDAFSKAKKNGNIYNL